MKDMVLDKLSSEEIISMFEIAFEEQVASRNNILAFSVSCNDRSLNKPVEVNVDVSGFAGTPTIDEFKAGSVPDANTVIISRDDIGEKTFELVPSLTTFLSGNDYLIVYTSK
jgi:uncharacterized membrane protein